MADISNALFSTTDASNNAASPNGYNSSTTPANVIAIEQAFRGAVKRWWERSGPAITAGGTANAITYTPSDTSYPTAYVQGDAYAFIAANTNSGATTFQVIANSLTAIAIKKNSSTGLVALSGGEIQSNAVVFLMYDGTQFEILNPVAAGISGYAELSGASFAGAVNLAQATNLASSSTTAIGAANGNYINITGTTTITAFDTIQAGTERVLNFNGALTLTYNATSLILPGKGNITTTAGDVGYFTSLGSGKWICTSYQPAGAAPFTPSASLATNGWRKNADGSIEQWGSANVSSSGTVISLPISFPNNIFNVVTTNAQGFANPIVTSVGTSSITITLSTGGPNPCYWRAIGN